MASVYVLDSSFKRTQVKVTPGRYLREVLEEACASRKWNPEEYSLKAQNGKVVDLSQPFRLSGLTAGAKLQLVQASRSPSVVSVALQLPENEGGTRLSDKFASNTSLWLVLRKFEEGVAGQNTKKLNITQQGVPSSASGAGRLLYRQPCVNAMGRSLETFGDLQKTLGQLGFSSGSVLMRLSYKDTDRPLEEAMTEISQYFESSVLEDGPAKTVAVAPATVETTNAATTEPAPVSTQPETAPLESTHVKTEDIQMTDNTLNGESSTQATSSTAENGISVFLPPVTTTPAAALQEVDQSVFEPSIDDAKAHQASLQRAGRNTRLLSDKELEEQESEKQAKLATVQKVDVRIRYPDQSMIEVTVHASETAAGLHSRVRECLRHANEPFELRFVGARGHQTLPDDATKRLVRDFSFRGKVLVTCVWHADASSKARTDPPLKEALRLQAQELKVDLPQHSNAPDEPRVVAPPKEEKPREQGKGDLEAKMKRFLGFGKK